MKKGKKILTGILAASLAAGCTVPAFAAEGWRQNPTGWWYEKQDGSYETNSWRLIDGQWYYFGADGYMDTGWVLDQGTWYFCNAQGAMLTGWVEVEGVNYYLNPVSDGTKGAMRTGEVTIDGKVYHFDASGACTDLAATPAARFYRDGRTVYTVVSDDSHSSSRHVTSEDGQHVNEEVKQEIQEVAPTIEENEAIISVRMVTSADLEEQRVMVAVDDELSDDVTIGETDVEASVMTIADTLLADENVVKIEYPKAGLSFDLTAEGADPELIKEEVSKALERLGDESLSYLRGKTYTGVVTMADGGTVTYDVVFTFQ